MIKYIFENTKLLFVGINPHHGSFFRGVPFSNNKLFWYLLSDSGLIACSRQQLKNDAFLKDFYFNNFSQDFGLGLVNLIDRPTRNISELKKGEEKMGKLRLEKIIKIHKPPIVCFIGKDTFRRFSGNIEFDYGWQTTTFKSEIFVMHTPLRGEASIRVKELEVLRQKLESLEPVDMKA